jgi:hypothetical protein
MSGVRKEILKTCETGTVIYGRLVNSDCVIEVFDNSDKTYNVLHVGKEDECYSSMFRYEKEQDELDEHLTSTREYYLSIRRWDCRHHRRYKIDVDFSECLMFY